MFQAVATTPVVPMSRPSGNSPAEIMRLLDAGAARLVAACRHPLAGGRSFGPACGLLCGGAGYVASANAESLVVAMIGTRDALDDLGAVLDTPGLAGVHVGPNDLVTEPGRPPRNGHDGPSVASAIARARPGAGRPPAPSVPMARRRGGWREGHLVTPGNDGALLRATLAAGVGAARGGQGERKMPS